MKATPLAAFAAFLFAALCAVSPAPASAQGRGDIFAVSGIQVDETAANGSAAQQAAFASASRLGFERLAQRLTTPAEQSRFGIPTPDASTLERLAISVDIEDSRRSANRFIGRLTVRFNADGVRDILRNAGYAIVETRSAPILIVPTTDPSAAPELTDAWRRAWSEGGYGQELVPLAVAAPMPFAAPSWEAVQANAASEGALTAIYAVLTVQGGSASAQLVEVSANGQPQVRGRLSAPVSGTDAGQLNTALRSLASQVNAQIQNTYKATAAPTNVANNTNSNASNRSRVSASALYANEAQWEQIKAALEGSAATLISGIRIEAVGRDGALVSFQFTGTREQLAAELRGRGVTLEDSSMGPVLRVAAAR